MSRAARTIDAAAKSFSNALRAAVEADDTPERLRDMYVQGLITLAEFEHRCEGAIKRERDRLV